MMTPTRETHVQTAGASLRVREYGAPNKAAPIILIHGGPGIMGYMGGLAEVISKTISGQRHVIDYDQRGGSESPSNGPFRLEDHVDDLRQLIQATCPGTKPILLGHSWGGIVGLAFCARFPEEAGKLVIVGCGYLDRITFDKQVANVGGRLSLQEFATMQALFRKLGDPSLSDSERTQCDHQLIKLIFPVYQHDRTSLAQMPLHPRNLGPTYEADADYSAKRDSGEILKLLENVRTPVAAIHGDVDVISHDGIFPHLKKYLPVAPELFLIENSGHMPWLEPNAKTHFAPVLNQLLTS
jgi:proline iminopeptidase